MEKGQNTSNVDAPVVIFSTNYYIATLQLLHHNSFGLVLDVFELIL